MSFSCEEHVFFKSAKKEKNVFIVFNVNFVIEWENKQSEIYKHDLTLKELKVGRLS